MLITFAIIGAIAGGFLAGRGTKGVLERRGARHARETGLREFQRACDASRIAIGKLAVGTGDWCGGKLKLGGLFYSSTHNLPLGRLVAAALNQGGCRYCGSRIHALFEVAERAKDEPKPEPEPKTKAKKVKRKGDEKQAEPEPQKENYPLLLCSLCPNLNCGLIERNGGYSQSQRYGIIIEVADDVRALLVALESRRQDLTLSALEPPLLPGPMETSGD